MLSAFLFVLLFLLCLFVVCPVTKHTTVITTTIDIKDLNDFFSVIPECCLGEQAGECVQERWWLAVVCSSSSPPSYSASGSYHQRAKLYSPIPERMIWVSLYWLNPTRSGFHQGNKLGVICINIISWNCTFVYLVRVMK